MKSLGSLALTRLLFGLLTIVVVSTVVFFAVELLPGDVAQQILGRDATPETLASLRERLGLDQPAVLRMIKRSSQSALQICARCFGLPP